MLMGVAEFFGGSCMCLIIVWQSIEMLLPPGPWCFLRRTCISSRSVILCYDSWSICFCVGWCGIWYQVQVDVLRWNSIMGVHVFSFEYSCSKSSANVYLCAILLSRDAVVIGSPLIMLPAIWIRTFSRLTSISISGILSSLILIAGTCPFAMN